MELQQALKSSEEDELKRVLKSSEDDELQRAIKESQLTNPNVCIPPPAQLFLIVSFLRFLHLTFHHSRCCGLQVMDYSTLSRSDADATYFELEQAVLAQSLQTYQNNEEGKKQSATTTSTKRKQDDVDHSLSSHMGRSSTTVDPLSECAGVTSAPASSKYYAAAASASAPTSSASSSAYAESSAAMSSSNTSHAVDGISTGLQPVHEYPDCVQELVMNGFELASVVKVMEIVGPSFDDMLSLLMSNQR
jgi:hypothetical protein